MKANILKILKEYSLITLGIFLYSFSWTSFLIPEGITGGGVPGLASVIYYATFELIPVSVSYFVVNAFLVIVGTLILGKGFGFKTLYSIIMATIFLEFLPQVITWTTDVDEQFLNALLGGSIGAIGIVMVFKQGGSTGGTDIVALIITKYKEITPGKVFLFCDLLIVGSIFFLPDKNLSDVIYGYIQMLSFSLVLDAILRMDTQSVQMLVFSEKYQKIADVIVNDVRRGVTVLDGQGWFSKNDKKILLVVIRKTQMAEVTRKINEIDSKAFTTTVSTENVYGTGFDNIKVGAKGEWKKSLKKLSKSSKTT